MMEGWLCPRCKKVNAPWVSQCACTGCHETITTNTPYCWRSAIYMAQ